MVFLLVAGVISPGLVWCHESDGRINVEFGQCTAIPFPKSTSESSSFLGFFDGVCDSCVDTAVFTVGPSQDFSKLLTGLIAQAMGNTVINTPADSEFLHGSQISPSSDEIYPLLISIQSTVLLI